MPYKDPQNQREADRRWREANPEKAQEAHRRWREANPEKQREATRRWHEANPEYGRWQSRRWREARHIETTLCKPEDERLRSGWSRFLMSLILRHPEGVQRLTNVARQFQREVAEDFKANYDQHRLPSDPPAYEEYRKGMKSGPMYEAQTAIMLLQRLMDNPQLGSFLNGLVWKVVQLESAYTLLTSDRPLVMTNGLVKPGDHLALAIGPRKLFIAANTPDAASSLAALRHDDLVGQMNDGVCKQARRYVFAIDDRQRTFIDRRLGLKWPSTPVDT